MLESSKYGSSSSAAPPWPRTRARCRRSACAADRLRVAPGRFRRHPRGDGRAGVVGAAPDLDHVEIVLRRRDGVGKAAPPGQPPSGPAPHDHGADVLGARVADQRFDHRVAGEDRGARAEVLRELHDAQDALALRGGQPLQRAASRRTRPATPRPAVARGARRCAPPAPTPDRPDAAEQPRLRLPHRADRLVGAVLLHRALDQVRGAAQRQLAQRDEVALAEEVRRRALAPARAGRPCPPSGAPAAPRRAGRPAPPRRPSSKNVSGTVSHTLMPVMPPTTSFRLSRCCTLSVV